MNVAFLKKRSINYSLKLFRRKTAFPDQTQAMMSYFLAALISRSKQGEYINLHHTVTLGFHTPAQKGFTVCLVWFFVVVGFFSGLNKRYQSSFNRSISYYLVIQQMRLRELCITTSAESHLQQVGFTSHPKDEYIFNKA